MSYPKSHFAPQFLTRLLFDFQEPFDKEKTMEKGWDYGGEAKLDIHKLIFFYQIHFSLLFDILDTVFTPYIHKPNELVKPDPMVVSDFSVILNSFYLIQNHWEFKLRKVYCVNFTPFDPIEGDYERIIKDWERLRGEYIDHKAKIFNICRLNAVPEYKIPYRMERFIKAITNNLSKQKEYQRTNKPQIDIVPFPPEFKWDEVDSRIFFFGTRGTLIFTAKKSIKLSVFKMIVEKRGEPLHVNKIAWKIDRDPHYVYSVIRDLKEMIEPHIKGVYLSQDNGTVFISFSSSKPDLLKA